MTFIARVEYLEILVRSLNAEMVELLAPFFSNNLMLQSEIVRN